MSRGAWNGLCWWPVSGSCGCPRTGWAHPAARSAGLGSPIARAVVKDGAEEFPAAFLNEQAMEIRLLLDHRRDLVAERTRTVNRLRWHLVVLSPELERPLKRGAFNDARVLGRVDRALRRLTAGARVRVAREQLSRIRTLNRQVEQLASELLELVKAHRPQLSTELACGPLVAAMLIGHTAGAQQFKSDASFALLASVVAHEPRTALDTHARRVTWLPESDRKTEASRERRLPLATGYMQRCPTWPRMRPIPLVRKVGSSIRVRRSCSCSTRSCSTL